MLTMLRANPRCLPVAVAWIGLCVTLPSQTTWTVNTIDGIQPAIQAASPGDVIVLTDLPGDFDYLAFHLDKGLTIVGNDAEVHMPPQSFQFPNPPWEITFAIPAGQVAHVRNLRATYGYSPWGGSGLPVIVQSGSVRFEDCEFMSMRGVPSLQCNGDVVVSGGTIIAVSNHGPTTAVRVLGGRLTLRDVVIRGSQEGCQPIACTLLFPPTPALDAIAGEVHVERAALFGGSNTVASWALDGAPAVRVQGARVRIADSALVGGSTVNGAGGEGLRHLGGPSVELLDTSLIGGTPGGASSTGIAPSQAPLVRLARSGPWTRGAVTTVTIAGPANVSYGLLIAPDSTGTTLPAIAEEPLYVLGGIAVDGGVFDANGFASLTVAVPNVAALEHVAVWCQAVAGTSLPLRASTITGGLVR